MFVWDFFFKYIYFEPQKKYNKEKLRIFESQPGRFFNKQTNTKSVYYGLGKPCTYIGTRMFI